MLLQPVMGTPIFTVEEFDNFVVPGQHLDPSPKTNPTDAHPKHSLKPILKKEPGVEQIVDYTCRICQKPFEHATGFKISHRLTYRCAQNVPVSKLYAHIYNTKWSYASLKG